MDKVQKKKKDNIRVIHRICLWNCMVSQNHGFVRILLNPVVLWGRENCYLALRVHHRLRVFDNSAERKIFGSKSEEVTEG